MIRQLPPDVVARIAAGEVIERPASVVKELLENALDAAARTVDVELVGGGVELVRVSDDGHGIPADEVELAFQRHATSKIRSDADLRALSTLGFRGEALPSMATVARVRLTTRHQDEAIGTTLSVEFGRLSDRRQLGRAVGTSVAVADVFEELPARRKFLKPRAVEASAALHVVAQYAVAYPEVAFSASVDGRPALRTAGDGDRVRVLAAVHGPELARDVLELIPATGTDRGTVFAAVSGLAGRQSLHRANRTTIILLVNRRVVQHRALIAAVEQAYHTLLPTGRHPVAVIEVSVPPDEADFNVHPAKLEVKLLRERAVAALVHRAILDTLAEHMPLLSWGDDSSASHAGEALGHLRVLGQVGGTYIVAEGGAGIYLVDQHAAHERVLLEDLRRSRDGDEHVQLLLEPVPVQLEPRHAALATQHIAALASLGFSIEEFGPRSLLVRGVPTIAADRDPAALLQSTLDGADEEAGPTDWRERLALSLSCHTAVRAGDPLTPEEMSSLLVRLGEAELCRTCSHGRPTAILLSLSQLEKEFGRR